MSISSNPIFECLIKIKLPYPGISLPLYTISPSPEALTLVPDEELIFIPSLKKPGELLQILKLFFL